ncbi:RNA-guided endonuclease InsQ/TnpB family protein [Sulfurihydrogenibium subterraneum]|uniref:RNA-guided endonuclease InsQ/TnpB family protein n=1 Tax=Sulfurihydrogenibium subterraneum TaxID=171121 RepID=UPI000684D21F|nr:RNA-guided endonuclease TnpB family protein [Sulfurihydrogenibium subterraneum]
MQLNKTAKRILSIRISGKQRKEKISNLLYSLAQFRNLLIIFNKIYQQNYGRWILNESYLYALVNNKGYKPRESKENFIEKLKEFKTITDNIEKVNQLKDFQDKLIKQKQKIKNNYTVQTLIRQLIKDYKSFFKSIQKYKENSNSFNAIPRPPKAKKLKDIPSFTAELNVNTFKVLEEEKGKHLLITLTNNKEEKQYLKVKLPKDFNYEIKSARIKFIASDIYVDIVYTIPETQINSNQEKTHIAGIDLGLDNLITLFSTNKELQTIIVSGKEIKSINQWYNKEKAKLQSKIDNIQNQINKLQKDNLDTTALEKEKKLLIKKQKELSAYRNRWITDTFHKITRKITDFLNETGHKEVYIGKGATESKNGINLSTKTNQNFVNIPFRKLINQLKYKLEEYGVKLTEVAEEFTSKTSPFADLHKVLETGKEYLKAKTEGNEGILKQLKEKLNQLYNGIRIKRGLYKDNITNKVFNANAVGSYNILRKEAKPLIDEETLIDKLSRPIRLTLNLISKVTCESLLEIAGRRPLRVHCKRTLVNNFL